MRRGLGVADREAQKLHRADRAAERRVRVRRVQPRNQPVRVEHARQQLVDDLREGLGLRRVAAQDAGREELLRLQQEPGGRAGAERVVDREDASGAEEGYCAVHAWSQSARAAA